MYFVCHFRLPSSYCFTNLKMSVSSFFYTLLCLTFFVNLFFCCFWVVWLHSTTLKNKKDFISFKFASHTQTVMQKVIFILSLLNYIKWKFNLIQKRPLKYIFNFNFQLNTIQNITLCNTLYYIKIYTHIYININTFVLTSKSKSKPI